MSLLMKFNSSTIDNIPQKDNQHVDARTSIASLISPPNPSKDIIFVVHPIMKPSNNDTTGNMLATTKKILSKWYDDIYI